MIAPVISLAPLWATAAGPESKGKDGNQLDLSRLIIWRLDENGFSGEQIFYDRSGKRLGDLGLKFGFIGQPHFSEGLAVVNGLEGGNLAPCGYVDRTGRVMIPLRYALAGGFRHGRAVAALLDPNGHMGYRMGLIDRKGRWVVPAGKYASMSSGGQGRWAFAVLVEPEPLKGDVFSESSEEPDNGERWGFLDDDGRVVVKPRYQDVGAFYEGLCPVWDGDRHGYINRQGDVVFWLPENTDRAGVFCSGRAQVALHTGRKRRGPVSSFGGRIKTDVQHGFVDRTGKFVIEAVYMGAGPFWEGLAPVSKSPMADDLPTEDEMMDNRGGSKAAYRQRWGFIDPNGKLVIPMAFSRVSPFIEGRARARSPRSGKWGFIDKTGKFVIPARHDWVRSFDNGVAEVVLDGKVMLIDRIGKVLVNRGTPHVVF